jgi:hypothetical protein
MSAVSYQIGACIGKTGKQVHLTLADTTPINGVCSAARITGVGGNPTFYRNGKPVQIGKPRVYSATQDSPNFSYGIYCGGVKGFMIEDGGEGYSLATAVPSLDSSGSGGSGTVLGKLVVEQGVTSYRIDQPGGGFPLPPTATIVDLDGPGAGALCYVVVYEGGVTKVVVTDGGGGYVKPAIRFSGGTAAGVVVASGGVVTDVVMTDFGYGYPNPPVVTVGPPLNTSGPQGNIPANAYAIIYGADAASWNGKPGSVRAIVPFVGGLLGCGQGYVPASPPPVSVAVPAGATAPVVAAVVSGYVASLGVAQPGSDHNAMPDVVVAGGTRPAVLKPIMTGASPSDVFAADVPDGWITGLLGGQTVATSAVQSLSVVNSTGRFEPPIGGMPGFLAKPTMRVGGNHGAQPVSRYVNYQTFKNKLHVSYQMRVYFGAGTINYAPDNSPTDWTNPSGAVLGSLFYGPSTGNGVDNMGAASSVGQWTLVYDDAGVGTPNAAVANLISVYNSDKVTIKPVSLSGPSQPIVIPPENVKMSGSSITSISLANITLPKGWQGAAVYIADEGRLPGYAMCNVTVSGGVPTAIDVVVGGNFLYVPTVYLYGTRVSGSEVSHRFNVSHVPTTGPGTGPIEWSPTLALIVAQPKGVWTLGNPWVVAPDPRTGTGTPLPLDRSNNYAVDDWVLDAIRSDGRSGAAFRFMDSAGTYGGETGYVFDTDLIDGDRLNWIQPKSTTVSFQFARAFNTDPSSTVYGWHSDRVYGPQNLFLQGPDSFGRYISLPPGDNGRFLSTVPWVGCIELRSTTPHGLATGQSVAMNGSTPVPMSDSEAWYPGHSYVAMHLFVTGPYTVVFGYYVGGGSHSKTIQSVSGDVEIPIDWTVTLSCPVGGANVPIEYTASFVSQSPGSALWVNIPHSGTEGVIRAYVRRIAPRLRSDNHVLVEHGNENWNFAYSTGYHQPLFGLLSNLPPDTPVLGTTIGALNLTSPAKAVSLNTANSHAIFLDEWKKMGQDPSRVHCVYGGQYMNSAVAEMHLDVAHRGGFPIHHICLAFYADLPPDASVVQAMSPSGSVVGGAESAEADVINEIVRWSVFHRQSYWNEWELESSLCRNFGQPVTPTSIVGMSGYFYCTMSGGAVVSTTRVAAGVGYRKNPSVFFGWPAAGGRVATGRCFLEPSPISLVKPVTGGSNYGPNPPVTITGGGGTYQSATAQVVNGAVVGVTVVGSSGYTTTDDISVILTDATGSGATFSVYLAPTSLGTIKITDGGAGYADATDSLVSLRNAGSDLPSGTYTLFYTYVDSQGRETTVGNSQSNSFQLLGGEVLVGTMPAWSPWVKKINWYVSYNGGRPTLYESMVRGGYADGSMVPFYEAIPANGASPPAVNQAVGGDAPVPVTIIMYEGSLQTLIAPWVPLRNLLLHDALMHPSAGDCLHGYYLTVQQGNPQHPGSGAILMAYFQIYGFVQYPWMWVQALGSQQMPGDGSSNRFCTRQGGDPADGHDHTPENDSPMLGTFNRWIGWTSPMVETPGVESPRWYTGMYGRS